jgi:hypothetical protein
MIKKYWREFGPSLLVGTGIILSAWLDKSAGSFLTGMAVLALMIVGADMLQSHFRGKPRTPSLAILILAGSLVLASLIMGNANSMNSFIPLIVAASWTSLLINHEGQRKTCPTR